MSICRLIHIKVDPKQAAEVERIWKQDCATLMIRQGGCTSEQLLKCIDAPGEYISYSEWENQAAIDRYRKSDDHKTIQTHAQALQGARAGTAGPISSLMTRLRGSSFRPPNGSRCLRDMTGRWCRLLRLRQR